MVPDSPALISFAMKVVIKNQDITKSKSQMQFSILNYFESFSSTSKILKSEIGKKRKKVLAFFIFPLCERINLSLSPMFQVPNKYVYVCI